MDKQMLRYIIRERKGMYDVADLIRMSLDVTERLGLNVFTGSPTRSCSITAWTTRWTHMVWWLPFTGRVVKCCFLE